MALELEHMIGFSGASMSPLHVHPNGSDVVYAQGGCVVVADLRDPHKQAFLRGHDAAVTCLALSTSGRYIVSGQSGDNADVIVWDFETKAIIYRFQEHDHGVAVVSLSSDERFVLTVGNTADGKLVVWDMLTGNIVVNKKSSSKTQHTCACWGGRKKDAKGRETTEYQLATGGPSNLTYWTLSPMEGTMVAEECSLGNQVRPSSNSTPAPAHFFLDSHSQPHPHTTPAPLPHPYLQPLRLVSPTRIEATSPFQRRSARFAR